MPLAPIPATVSAAVCRADSISPSGHEAAGRKENAGDAKLGENFGELALRSSGDVRRLASRLQRRLAVSESEMRQGERSAANQGGEAEASSRQPFR